MPTASKAPIKAKPTKGRVLQPTPPPPPPVKTKVRTKPKKASPKVNLGPKYPEITVDPTGKTALEFMNLVQAELEKAGVAHVDRFSYRREATKAVSGPPLIEATKLYVTVLTK